MDLNKYLDNRIMDLEDRLKETLEAKSLEMDSPLNKRNHRVLYLLHKDETLYNFCIAELKAVKMKNNE